MTTQTTSETIEMLAGARYAWRGSSGFDSPDPLTAALSRMRVLDARPDGTRPTFRIDQAPIAGPILRRWLAITRNGVAPGYRAECVMCSEGTQPHADRDAPELWQFAREHICRGLNIVHVRRPS